jgi:hypothetical protein
MKIAPEDYAQLREWFARMWPLAFSGIEIAPEANPTVALDEIAAKSPARARQGLAMAIGDLVEAVHGWRTEEVEIADRRLSDAGLPTLSAIRTRFSQAVQRALRRGRIDSEQEYYAIRNAVEMTANDPRLSAMLAAYEQAAG